ncbi:PTS sugar transporter subunit IIA, partial [Salmonella enterica subsp. enterica serovar Virginia]|nr:PTS sugar transporter subunit IIA [Salmonella enterica subsp. enterica serovar Virginia]
MLPVTLISPAIWVEANTWQEAVKIGVDLLVAADVVEPRYYQAILDGVEQFGPYFV